MDAVDLGLVQRPAMAGKRRQREKKPDKPWDTTELSGIIVNHNERKAARYLGYSDFGAYRTYLCSHVFLDVWLPWKTYNTTLFQSKPIFKLLAAAAKTNEGLESKYGGSLQEVLDRYPLGASSKDDAPGKLKRQHLIAGLVYQLMHSTRQFRQEQQAVVKTTFDARYGQDGKKLPVIAVAPIIPIWGPLKSEDWGEPYNRAIGALQTMNLDLNRWSERQGKDDGLKSREIPRGSTPTFMDAHADQDEELWEKGEQMLIREPVEMLEAKEFPLYWANSIADKDTLEDLHGKIPTSTIMGPDPRSMLAAKWRDKIRELYEVERLKINFDSMVFRWEENDVDEDIDLISGDWTLAQEVFGRLLQKAIAKIKFKTRRGDQRVHGDTNQITELYHRHKRTSRKALPRSDQGPER